MHIKRKSGILFLCIIALLSCNKKSENEPLRGGVYDFCSPTKIIASSIRCDCNISFSDFINTYTFTSIESSYYEIGPPCNQNVFKIQYINSAHEHNEPDYEFGFYLPGLSPQEFFRIDTFAIDIIDIFQMSSTGGYGEYEFDVNVTFIWDSVFVSNDIYWGSGKFIINDSIPTNFPNYFWPEQDIKFEFCNP